MKSSELAEKIVYEAIRYQDETWPLGKMRTMERFIGRVPELRDALIRLRNKREAKTR